MNRILFVLFLLPLVIFGQNKPIISMYDYTTTIRFLHSDSVITEVPKSSIAYVIASTNQNVSFGIAYGGTGLKTLNVTAANLTTPSVADAGVLLDTVTAWLSISGGGSGGIDSFELVDGYKAVIYEGGSSYMIELDSIVKTTGVVNSLYRLNKDGTWFANLMASGKQNGLVISDSNSIGLYTYNPATPATKGLQITASALAIGNTTGAGNGSGQKIFLTQTEGIYGYQDAYIDSVEYLMRTDDGSIGLYSDDQKVAGAGSYVILSRELLSITSDSILMNDISGSGDVVQIDANGKLYRGSGGGFTNPYDVGNFGLTVGVEADPLSQDSIAGITLAEGASTNGYMLFKDSSYNIYMIAGGDSVDLNVISGHHVNVIGGLVTIETDSIHWVGGDANINDGTGSYLAVNDSGYVYRAPIPVLMIDSIVVDSSAMNTLFSVPVQILPDLPENYYYVVENITVENHFLTAAYDFSSDATFNILSTYLGGISDVILNSPNNAVQFSSIYTDLTLDTGGLWYDLSGSGRGVVLQGANDPTTGSGELHIFITYSIHSF